MRPIIDKAVSYLHGQDEGKENVHVFTPFFVILAAP